MQYIVKLWVCGGDIVFSAKRSNPCTQDAVDAVNIGGRDIVFSAKGSNLWMQWTQWNSGIWWRGHCLWCKKVKPVDTVNAME